jgi:hypothetical protein
MIKIFQIIWKNPILIAHNGERFDFPILEYHKIIDYIKDESKSNKLIKKKFNNIEQKHM